jgi:hypothetical protein
MALLEQLWNDPRRWPGQALLMAMTAPFVLCGIGVLELVTGKPLRLLESAWGRLKEWQQGLLSFLLLCLAIGVLLLLVHWATLGPCFWPRP